MEKLLQAAALSEKIFKSCDTSDKANALIQKWSSRDLGPNPLDAAASLEARNQVFGWGI